MLHAVCVGIDLYRDSRITPLTCARNDATAVAKLLQTRIREPERRVTLLVDEQATRDNVSRAVGEELPRAVGLDDVVLIYFACHGCPERAAPASEDSIYLVMHDTAYDRVYSTGFDLASDIPRWLQRIRAELVVMLVDSCFSGAAGGRSFTGPVRAKNRDRYLSDEPISLRELNLGRARAIIGAADEDQRAAEIASLGHGVFTYCLLQVLRQPPGDSAVIRISALYDQVAQMVSNRTRGRQVPVFNGRDVRGALPRLGIAPNRRID